VRRCSPTERMPRWLPLGRCGGDPAKDTSLRRTTQIGRVRRHALTLITSGRQNYVTPSPLTHKLVESDYADTPEQELLALARTLLQAARLTTFTVRTKAEAVSIIEGIRPAGRLYAW
jgi:hypothetical protein